MNEQIWETFEGLFKTLHRQGRRVEELEARVVELERRLQERAGQSPPPTPFVTSSAVPPSKFALVPDSARLGVTIIRPGEPPEIKVDEDKRASIIVADA
jgi:hypothetical protein